jgi:hypothetical protein
LPWQEPDTQSLLPVQTCPLSIAAWQTLPTQLPEQQSLSPSHALPPCEQLHTLPLQLPEQQSVLPPQATPPPAHAHFMLAPQTPEQHSAGSAPGLVQVAPGAPQAHTLLLQLPLQQVPLAPEQAIPCGVQAGESAGGAMSTNSMSGTFMSGTFMSGTGISAPGRSASDASMVGMSCVGASAATPSRAGASLAGRSPVDGSPDAGIPSLVGWIPVLSKLHAPTEPTARRAMATNARRGVMPRWYAQTEGRRYLQ